MSAGLMKGTAGYRRRHTVRQALILVLLLLLIAGQILFARKIGGNLGILFTFTGILTALPLGNAAAPFLAMGMIPSVSKERAAAFEAFRDRGILLLDLTFTTQAWILPADCCLVRPGAVLIFLNGGKAVLPEAGETKQTALKKVLGEALERERLHTRLNLYEDEHLFLKALETLPPEDGKAGDREQAIAALLKQLSY